MSDSTGRSRLTSAVSFDRVQIEIIRQALDDAAESKLSPSTAAAATAMRTGETGCAAPTRLQSAGGKSTATCPPADQGIPVASKSWTVAEYLTYWLLHVVREERRPKTYQGYEGIVRLHLIPGLGKKRLDKLTAREVRVFITTVREECQCCKHGYDAEREKPRCCALNGGECCQARLSTRMVQSIHAVLRNALECAVREETIPRNVAKLVKVTTPNYKLNCGLTTAQARTVLRVAAGHRLYALYALALFLGLRRGELLGLRWVDVDLDGEKLEVVQALQRVGGRLRFVHPKTGDSERTVPLPRFCVEALRAQEAPVRGAVRSVAGLGRSRARVLLAAGNPRWSRTTSAGAGARSSKRPVSARHAFMICAIRA